MIKFLCAVLLFVVVVAEEGRIVLTTHDCGSVDSVINSITVNCTSEPCVVHKGASYLIQVNFTATKDVQEAHNVLHGGLGIFQVPFPLPPENACNTSVPCPIKAGQTYVYSNIMTCPSFAPEIRVSARWELKDEHHRDIFCFITALQIQS